MRNDKSVSSQLASLKWFILIIVAVWTGVIAASLGSNIYWLKQTHFRIVRASAEITFDKDVLYRRWATLQGGIYVPASEMTPPNPHLNVPYRDVTTLDGQSLTLVNPAYMTRQVYELAWKEEGTRGHITSLNPIRPENSPDPWEGKALESFELGFKEAVSYETISEKEYFRFMRPLITEKGCLKCHAAQGYKEGDIRGGISVSIPMDTVRAVEISRIEELTLTHGLIWALGLTGIYFGGRRIWNQTIQRQRAEEEILTLSITDQLTGLYNRRGFLSLAEQQVRLSNRNKKGMALFFADMDGLKWINDNLGHEEGDRAIMEAAGALRETFRASDVIARLGGDEFAALAIDIEEEHSEIFTVRLQSLLDARNRPGNDKYKLSISVGHSYYDPETPLSIDELMARADQLMYERKQKKKANLS